MNELTKNILIKGIKLKIKKGENLEEILVSYTKLTEEEKQQLKLGL